MLAPARRRRSSRQAALPVPASGAPAPPLRPTPSPATHHDPRLLLEAFRPHHEALGQLLQRQGHRAARGSLQPAHLFGATAGEAASRRLLACKADPPAAVGVAGCACCASRQAGAACKPGSPRRLGTSTVLPRIPRGAEVRLPNHSPHACSCKRHGQQQRSAGLGAQQCNRCTLLERLPGRHARARTHLAPGTIPSFAGDRVAIQNEVIPATASSTDVA